MNPTPDHNLEPPSGQPSSQSNMGQPATLNMASFPHDQLHHLKVAKAQAELAEASVRVQIAEENLEEAKHDKLASVLMNLPHRSIPIKIYNDGLSWIVKYECSEGEPLVGRGDTPQLAMIDFDHQWLGTK